MAITPIRRDGADARPAEAAGPAFLSVGFRPFFLLASAWAAIAIPVWLAAHVYGYALQSSLHPIIWHVHEMVFGFGIAAVSGFLLTAVPGWTRRPPLRGAPLAALAALWLAGRVALLISAIIGAGAAAAIDLAFPAALIAVIARELVAGRNWRNMPILAALSLFLVGSALVHAQAIDMAYTADAGQRIGIAALLALIALVGGRIVPSFTRNWLAMIRPDVAPPLPTDKLDVACLAAVVAGLVVWIAAPSTTAAAWMLSLAGMATALRLARWRGLATWREPLLLVLHAGYAWLAFGLAFLGLNGLFEWAPASAPLHALTVGAIGTMTLAVMTRATLGHTGRALTATPTTVAIYLLVTVAAVLRVAATFTGPYVVILTVLAGAAWAAAFAAYVAHYGPMLLRPRP